MKCLSLLCSLCLCCSCSSVSRIGEIGPWDVYDVQASHLLSPSNSAILAHNRADGRLSLLVSGTEGSIGQGIVRGGAQVGAAHEFFANQDANRGDRTSVNATGGAGGSGGSASNASTYNRHPILHGGDDDGHEHHGKDHDDKHHEGHK